MKLEETIRTLGFGPTLSGPIAVKAKTDALEVQAQSKKAIKRGKKGELLVGLILAKGTKLTDVEVSVDTDGFDVGKESMKKLDKKKVLKLKVKVDKSVKAGDHDVKVTITFTSSEAEAIEIKVPVEVK